MNDSFLEWYIRQGPDPADHPERADLHDLGWCHNCETFQRFEDAPVIAVSYLAGALHHCCIHCGEAEPWQFGVWDAERFLSDALCMPCLLRLCAQRVSGYDVQCEHLGSRSAAN